MADRLLGPPDHLVKINLVTSSTNTPDAGSAFHQKVEIPIPLLQTAGGIACKTSEIIYVSDFANHVIYKVKRGLPAVVFAGGFGITGSADGQGTAARFNKPGALALDNSGNLFVVDIGNAVLRRITENGNVHTLMTIPIPGGGTEPGEIAVDNSGNVFLIDNF